VQTNLVARLFVSDSNKQKEEVHGNEFGRQFPKDVEATSFWQGAVVVLDGFSFALIFLVAAPITSTKQTIAFSASQGVPLASIAVPLSGVVAIAGGLSIFAGLSAKLGPWLIVLFLIPVTRCGTVWT